MKRKTMKRKTMKRKYKGGAATGLNGLNVLLKHAMEQFNRAPTESKGEWLQIILELNERGIKPKPISAEQNTMAFEERMAGFTPKQRKEYYEAMLKFASKSK
jgi:hypothetical protein